MNQKMVANELGVNPSTTSIKLGRNTAKRGMASGHYLAANVQTRMDQRHYYKPKLVWFNPEMKDQALE